MQVLQLTSPPSRNINSINQIRPEDRAFHNWYRFVLSFPPHLVADFIKRWDLAQSQTCILDPFSGTGTTIVEAKKQGISGIGLESNPMAYLSGKVKVNWSIDPDLLWEHSQYIAEKTTKQLRNPGCKELDSEAASLILTGSISPLPLHKTLVLRENLEKFESPDLAEHQKLALARALVTSIGNLRFGPEVGITKSKADAPVVAEWLSNIRIMCEDLRNIQNFDAPRSQILLSDARACDEVLKPYSIDAVITSPPYPNEKDYTRTTRLESVILRLVSTKTELRQLKAGLLRSNTRNVYVTDKDDEWVREFSDIQRLAERIETRRVELGKTSGFEKLYARVTLLYFGGMARHLSSLRSTLRPGARLVYVVGDQASYLRIMIRTGQLLSQIAESLGYEVENIELFRTRFSTVTSEHLREEALILRWKG
jgi:hypothetical protein